MKILIPLTSFGPQGGFRVLSELANHWIKLGHDVEFLAYRASKYPNFPTNAKISWYDNDGEIHSTNNINTKKPIFRLFAILNRLKNAINKSDYDVILATYCFTAFPVAFSKKNKKKYYYIQAYEPEYYPGNNIAAFILRSLSKASYKLNLTKVVNSPLYFDYKEIKADKFVYPGLDFTKFRPLQKPNKATFIIGCIGRTEPYKGTAYVIEAFKKLKSNGNQNIELHVAFGSEELEKIEGVKIIKIKNDNELAQYYNAVHVIVAPGTYQLGAVHYPVIEAMACKTPVITTGYLPADENNSWIVPIKNSIAIKIAIEDIMANSDNFEYKTENAYRQIQEFGWDIVSKKMISYFE